jgi:hypothetical protein
MTVADIIVELDVEIAKLQQARAILTNQVARKRLDRPAVSVPSGKATSFSPEEFDSVPKKRAESAAARLRTVNAQSAPWAKAEKATKNEVPDKADSAKLVATRKKAAKPWEESRFFYTEESPKLSEKTQAATVTL